MEEIEKQLNNLSFSEVPSGMHQLVMSRINYHKIKPALFISFALLMINFLIISWRIDIRLIDAEFIDMGQDFLAVFSFNFSFISTIIGSFFEIIFPPLFFSAILSLGGAIYLGKKISLYRNLISA